MKLKPVEARVGPLGVRLALELTGQQVAPGGRAVTYTFRARRTLLVCGVPVPRPAFAAAGLAYAVYARACGCLCRVAEAR